MSTAHNKLHVLKLGGCCCRKGRSHTRPYYTGALGRRNHSHGSGSARANTKAASDYLWFWMACIEKDERKLL